MLMLCYWETTGICGSTERWVVTDPYHTWEEQPHVPFRGGHKVMGWEQASRLFVPVFWTHCVCEYKVCFYVSQCCYVLWILLRGGVIHLYFFLHANILFKHFQDALWWSVTGLPAEFWHWSIDVPRLYSTGFDMTYEVVALIIVWYLSFHRLGSSLTAFQTVIWKWIKYI